MHRVLFIIAFVCGLAFAGIGLASPAAAVGEVPGAVAEMCQFERSDGAMETPTANSRCRRLGDLNAVTPSCPSKHVITDAALVVPSLARGRHARVALSGWTGGPTASIDPPPPKPHSRTQ